MRQISPPNRQTLGLKFLPHESSLHASPIIGHLPQKRQASRLIGHCAHVQCLIAAVTQSNHPLQVQLLSSLGLPLTLQVARSAQGCRVRSSPVVVASEFFVSPQRSSLLSNSLEMSETLEGVYVPQYQGSQLHAHRRTQAELQTDSGWFWVSSLVGTSVREGMVHCGESQLSPVGGFQYVGSDIQS